MRIGIVLTTRWWRGSIDHDGYCSAILALGHEPVLVCHGNDAGKADFPVIQTTPERQADANFWRELRLDVAIVWNWMRGSALLRATQKAGVRTVIRADTDGVVSDRVFVLERLYRTIGNGATLRNRLGLAKHFVRTLLTTANTHDTELIATIEAANAVAVETEMARQKIERVLRHYQTKALFDKLHVVPHSVCNSIANGPLPSSTIRKQRIFCGGRWDSPQKDVKLLQRTLARVLAARPDCEAVVFGPIDARDQRVIESVSGNVTCAGPVDRTEVINALHESCILLSSSRWETHPIGALEALCCGCTVVAPPIPGFVDMLADGNYGTMAQHRTASGLATACLYELKMWENSARHPEVIARQWRTQVSNERVIHDLISTIYDLAP
jgi:glycosyltransferase involved in cell wall biosynthesis